MLKNYRLKLDHASNGTVLYPAELDLKRIVTREYKHDMSEMVFSYDGELTDSLFTEITTSEYDTIALGYQPLELVKANKIKSLKEACSNAFYDGFTTSFLVNDEPLVFGYEEHDQRNFNKQTAYLLLLKERLASGKITKEVYDAETVIHWKTKNKGVVKLTEEQFYGITRDIKRHEETVQGKYWALEAAVLAASTPVEVDSINW